MEKQDINVSAELKKLEAQIGSTIVNATKEEAIEVKRKINRLVLNVEEILVNQVRLPRGNVRRIVENLQDNLNYNIGRNLTGAREAEYNGAKEELSIVEKPETQDTLNELARFQHEGIDFKDGKYFDNIDTICEEVIHEYRRKLANMNTRGADDAYVDVKNNITRASNSIKVIHEEYSRRIKQEVSKKIDELGVELTASLDEEIEQIVDERTHDELSDFEKKLQGSCVPVEEIAENDSGELSENLKVFKDEKTKDSSARKDLESLFK